MRHHFWVGRRCTRLLNLAVAMASAFMCSHAVAQDAGTEPAESI